MPRRPVLAPILLLVALFACAGCGRIFERLVSDSATRLAYQIRDEAAALRKSGATIRTFEHRPVAWPDGPEGDYRIEFISSVLFTAKSYDGPLWSTTTYHRNYVKVPKDLKAAHRKGEPTLVTLELHDGEVHVTALQ